MSCGGHRDVTAAEPFRGVVGSSIAAVELVKPSV